MKLKYERFEGLSCFYVRGSIDASQFKLLTIGLETLVKDLQETLLVNLACAELDSASTMVLTQMKKNLATATKQKVHWIHKDRTLGDFPHADLFISRLSGAKYRQIGDKIKLDDALYTLAEELKHAEAKEKEIGGGAQSANQIILENKMMKAQIRILEECVNFQEVRMSQQHLIPAETEELQLKLTEAKGDLKKLLGQEVDL